ncbi:MAG: ATP-binding cassette domain-containing protein [Defluviitaleaceae bacterium]|nr:ATP-binding cassette domain-containing protein [Defluviitaleaceae bacterium]MCL2273312.1 ATP-binding cassette domain-containing protein [Defluviitaleaceae bacterium]
MSEPFLTVTDLCIGYEGKAIINDICFTVNNGAYVCIIGDNGAGKSTLIKTLAGLLKPIYGTTQFSAARHEIGYLPQQTTNQSAFPASAYEIVCTGALGQWYRPFYSKTEKSRIAWACEKTGVSPYAKQSYRELSGGQQQRVLLARALVCAKNAVILDEPTAGLDPSATQDFYALLHKINREENITIIMVTHDMDGVEKYATHIVELKEGEANCGHK